MPFTLITSWAVFAAYKPNTSSWQLPNAWWGTGRAVSRALATVAGAWRSWKCGIRRVYILWLCTASLHWKHFDRCFLRILQGRLFFVWLWGLFLKSLELYAWLLTLEFCSIEFKVDIKTSLYLPHQQGARSQDAGYHLQNSIKETASLPNLMQLLWEQDVFFMWAAPKVLLSI